MPPKHPKRKTPPQSPGSYRFRRGEKVTSESDRAPISKPPISSGKRDAVIKSRTYVKKLTTDRAPNSRHPRSSRPPASEPKPDPREAALQKRGEHYQEQRRVLQNMIGIVEQIGGHGELVRTLQLHARTKLTIAKGEILSDKLRAEAIGIWESLNNNIHFDKGGNPRLTLPALSELVKALEPRTKVDPDFRQGGSPHSLSPRENERKLRYDENRALRGAPKVEELDPQMDKNAYHALTMGANTATGRNGIEKTLELVRERVDQMSENQLAMALLHYEMIHGATVRTYDKANKSRSDITEILNDARARGLGPREMQANLARGNVKQGMNEAAKYGYELAKMLVSIIRMTEQEAVLSEALAAFTTPPELMKLKREVASMSDSPEKRSTLKVIGEAMEGKSHRRRKTPLPAQLEEKLR